MKGLFPLIGVGCLAVVAQLAIWAAVIAGAVWVIKAVWTA